MASPGQLSKLPVVGKGLRRLPGCSEILPRLFLGDIRFAINKESISSLGITDMLTIEIKPLPASDLAPTVKRYLYINVMDHSKQDILSHFNTSNEFIETALKTPSNKVYVHCVAGISRSASLVIAYIMKTRSMNYSEAFELVSQKRNFVDPNEGFVRQLILYHKMNYTVDIGNLEYRRIVFDALVFEFRLIALNYYQTDASKTSSGNTSAGSSSGGAQTMVHMPFHGHKTLASRNNIGILFDQFYNKLNLQQVSKFPQIYEPQTAFKCNKCRAIVFYAISLIENRQRNQQTPTVGHNSIRSSSSCSSTFARHSPFDFKSKDQTNKECSFYFIEPQPWMSKNVLEREGNLECYKCKRKLGKFDWTSAESCSCPAHNSHMNFNLFKIMKKKIDPGALPSLHS